MAVVPGIDEMLKWPTPNYVNPETRGPLLLGVEIPLLVLVIIVIAMRIYRYVFVSEILQS